MIGSTGMFAVIANAVVVLALWTAVVAGPRAARLPLALASFGCAWTLAFLLAGLHAPTWTIVASGGAIAINVVLLATAAQLSARGDSGGGGGEDGEGGLGTRPPERPSGGGGPAEPSWWPEFERDLRRYTTERERAAALAGRERRDRLVTR